MSVLTRRTLPIAIACAISTAALVLFIHEAFGQEAPKAVDSVPVEAAPAAAAPAAAAQDAPKPKGPSLPEVKIIQDPPKQEPAKEAAPKPKPKPAPVVEVDESAPAPKPKKKKGLASAPKPKAKPVQKSASAPEPQDPASAAVPELVNATGTYNPALDLDGVDLPPGTTITTAGPVNGYQALSAMSSTKTATPLERIPQSIQVVPKKVIEDQTSLTVTEAIQNASNVQGPNSRSLADTQLYPYTIRGFGAQAWLDGLVVPFSAGDRDAFANVERIEVLKGPSAILYGGGAGAPIGGAVNIVSKLPTDIAGGEFGFTFGSHTYLQPYFDINQPIAADGSILFRITGEYTAADSFIDVLEQDRYSINPTLTFTNKVDTTLTIQGFASSVKQQTYQGLPVTGTLVGGFRIDRDLFIGPADIPRGFSETQGVTVSLDHRFNDIWSANVIGRWSQAEFEQNTQLVVSGGDFSGGTPAIPPSTWLLANSELHEDVEQFTINPSAQARFNLGESRNILLFGADYSRVKEDAFLHVDYLGNGCAAFFGVDPCFGLVGPTVDLTNPVFTTPYADPRSVAQYQDFFGFDQIVSFGDTQNTFTTKGAYAQVQSTLYDRVHVLGGLRSANVKVEQVEMNLGIPQYTETDATKVLPRAGIVVDLTPGFSVYASYSEGMRAVPRQLPGGKSLPEFSEQREAGVKFNFNSQLAGTIAVFEIERDNVAVNLGLGNIGLATQKGRGFETDLIWQPDRNWQVLANYGFTDVEFGDGLLGAAAGNKFPLVPEHSGRLWVNYRFDTAMLQGWSVGAGIYASSGAFVDAANLYKTEAYFTVDAKIGYETEKFRASFNVKNLTGEEYLVPYAFLGGQVAPGDERAYYGTIVYKY